MTTNGKLIAAERDRAETYLPHEHEELLKLAATVETLRHDRDNPKPPTPPRVGS